MMDPIDELWSQVVCPTLSLSPILTALCTGQTGL